MILCKYNFQIWGDCLSSVLLSPSIKAVCHLVTLYIHIKFEAPGEPAKYLDLIKSYIPQDSTFLTQKNDK